MRYYAKFGDTQRSVDVEPQDGGLFRIRIDDGEWKQVDAQWVEARTLSLIVENKSYEVDFEPAEEGDGVSVLVRDELFALELMDDRKLRMMAASSTAGIEGPVVVRSPMPGKLVKLLVAVGDEVEEGQGVAIVEAMKMENELKSPKAGVVAGIDAAEGDAVEGRQPLVSIT